MIERKKRKERDIEESERETAIQKLKSKLRKMILLQFFF